MMTSVTLSSSSGAIHGGYSSVTVTESGAKGEGTSGVESEFEAASAAATSPTTSTIAARSIKRCLIGVPSGDSCKKRRKQSTPIRISAAELDEPATIPSISSDEGKPSAAVSPEPELRCPVCQLYFDTSDQLQNHIVSDHPPIECKKEVEELTPTSTPHERSDTPLELTMPRSDVQWMNELQNKDWKNPSLANISFNHHHTPTPNPMFMALPFVQSDSLPRQPIRIFNPDAYCDLCNKEFCNKYFLKTHKANKHGIYTDTPITEPMGTGNCVNVNIPSFTGNIKPPTSVPSVEIPFIKTETKLQTNFLNPFSDVYPNPCTPTMPPFSNKFSNKVTKQSVPATSTLFESDNNENQNSNGTSYPNETETKKISDDHIPDESSSPSVILTESTSFKTDLDGIMYYEQSKMSPGQQSREIDLSNRLRKIGVMNPKAFCEICCKEYCNKYFLRTHKMKRHGIYIPEDKDKDIKMETGLGNFSWPHSMQTSPLNLIMTEQSNVDRKTTSPNDIRCDLCGIKFQNASLAQLHNISVHGKLHPKEQPDDNNSEDNSKKSLFLQQQQQQQQTQSSTIQETSNSDQKSLNAEAISEDLQKLQTMILQLNDIDVSKVYRSCNSCNKEFENRYFLHAHMMTEHGVLLDDGTDVEKAAESENSSDNNTNNICELSTKEGQNLDEIKSHIIEFHQTREEPNKDECTDFSTPDKGVSRMTTMTSGQITDRRISMNVTPTSSYCDICNKELCNKYFMKTHMQRMHGIEIENGAQIGGVVCDICNKELCSKYFLRVHKHNTHGIVEYGSSLLPPRKPEGESAVATPSILQPELESPLKPADLADLSHRYFTHFTEVCTICSRRFRSTKWLKTHLLSDHGQAGAEKWADLEQQLQQTINQNKPHQDEVKSERSSPTIKIPNGTSGSGSGSGTGPGPETIQSRIGIQNVLSSLFGVDETNTKTYQCSYCSFTTSILPLLFVHERSHTISTNGELPQLKCPACPQNFLQPELLQHHLFTQHPFLPLPPFFNGNNNSHGEVSKEVAETTTAVEVEENSLPSSAEQKPIIKTTPKKLNKSKMKPRLELISADIGQSLKDAAKRAQLPATYALPQVQAQQQTSQSSVDQQQQEQGNPSQGQSLEEHQAGTTGYVMQAFLLEESAPERRVVPAVVFLPVVEKQPAPLTVTFTLTPA